MFNFKLLIAIMTLPNALAAAALPELTHDHPFSYDLGVKVIPSKKKQAHGMLCCHGYGHNNGIADVIHSFNVTKDHLISFNFPDYNIDSESDHFKATFGSFDEIAPLLYLLKRYVVDLQQDTINLYGFSAGAAAIINALAALNSTTYDKKFKKLGISTENKQQILDALENGLIILDCPLKSIEEVIAMQGSNPEFEFYKKHYAKNDMRPIDSVKKLAGLTLHILLGFQNPDEIVGNNDDALFIERLRAANDGTTDVVIASEGGHNGYHASLWKKYKKEASS